jgi:hypothetical protein
MYDASRNRDWCGQASLCKGDDIAGILLLRFVQSLHAIM